jgi:quercetin dioxygenase-like cupin family protein
MFFGHEKDKLSEKVIEGVMRKLLSTGERIQIFQLEMRGGTTVPEHAHPNEQAGYILQGKFESNIGGVKQILEKGHYFRIPGNVPHSGFVHEDTILLDIYSPPR